MVQLALIRPIKQHGQIHNKRWEQQEVLRNGTHNKLSGQQEVKHGIWFRGVLITITTIITMAVKERLEVQPAVSAPLLVIQSVLQIYRVDKAL